MTATANVYRVPRYTISLVREGDGPLEPPAPALKTPADAVPVLRSALPENTDREHFLVATLDTRNRIIGVNIVSTGSVNGSIVHPREVFKLAVLQNACAVIVCHNHPSGDPNPSREDHALTQRLKKAGTVLGIPVLDHVILGDGGDDYYSFQESGEL